MKPQALVDLLTADGEKIMVIPWAIWQISDPVMCVQTLSDVKHGELRVSGIVRSCAQAITEAGEFYTFVRSSAVHGPASLAPMSAMTCYWRRLNCQT